MKRLGIFLLVFSVVYLSCKKHEDGPGEIYGTWKLTETMQDPGDGSGKYHKVKGDVKYLTLDRSGQISGDALSHLQSFKVLDSVKMEVVEKASMNPLIYYYKVSASSLTINPPCIEGCGYRFVRK
jgi:hypothetical protein